MCNTWATRRALLEELGVERWCVRLGEIFDDGKALFAAVCEHGLEGIVAKRTTSIRAGDLNTLPRALLARSFTQTDPATDRPFGAPSDPPAGAQRFSRRIVDSAPQWQRLGRSTVMNPLFPSKILRVILAAAALLALAAPAGARDRNMLAQYGWGAAATFAKQQTRAALAARAQDGFLAQYGWGAASTYAKLHA